MAQGIKETVKSEWHSVMECIEVQNLPYPEREQTVCHESAPMRQFCRISVLYCIEDEGSPLGLVIQVMIPNHHKLLWSKATVVSVMGKGEAVTSSGAC